MIAAIMWIVGGVVLLLKGSGLLLEADAIRPGEAWPWWASAGGVFFGSLKAKFLFSKSCKKNLNRIAALNRPKVWQFFSPGFIVALIVMILVGVTLSRLAHTSYPFLIGVALLDISIGIALLGSSYVYWRQKAFLQ